MQSHHDYVVFFPFNSFVGSFSKYRLNKKATAIPLSTSAIVQHPPFTENNLFIVQIGGYREHLQERGVVEGHIGSRKANREPYISHIVGEIIITEEDRNCL